MGTPLPLIGDRRGRRGLPRPEDAADHVGYLTERRGKLAERIGRSDDLRITTDDAAQPGCLGVEPPLLTEDGTCLVGYSRWESREALLATGIDLNALAETSSGEVRPRQPYFLTASSNGST